MAATSQGIIGKDNTLPWHYPDELDHFKQTTNGHFVLMGRKTFQSCPESFFSNSIPIVLSQDYSFTSPIGKTVRNLTECLEFINAFPDTKEIFMIGGAKIAHLFLTAHLIYSFILTRIHYPYTGDTYLNMNLLKEWKEELIVLKPHYDVVHLYPKVQPTYL